MDDSDEFNKMACLNAKNGLLLDALCGNFGPVPEIEKSMQPFSASGAKQPAPQDLEQQIRLFKSGASSR